MPPPATPNIKEQIEVLVIDEKINVFERELQELKHEIDNELPIDDVTEVVGPWSAAGSLSLSLSPSLSIYIIYIYIMCIYIYM